MDALFRSPTSMMLVGKVHAFQLDGAYLGLFGPDLVNLVPDATPECRGALVVCNGQLLLSGTAGLWAIEETSVELEWPGVRGLDLECLE